MQRYHRPAVRLLVEVGCYQAESARRHVRNADATKSAVHGLEEGQAAQSEVAQSVVISVVDAEEGLRLIDSDLRNGTALKVDIAHLKIL